jgi:hypothetical protein
MIEIVPFVVVGKVIMSNMFIERDSQSLGKDTWDTISGLFFVSTVMYGYRLQKGKVDGAFFAPGFTGVGEEVGVLLGTFKEKWKCFVNTPKLIFINSFQLLDANADGLSGWATAILYKVFCNLLKEST